MKHSGTYFSIALLLEIYRLPWTQPSSQIWGGSRSDIMLRWFGFSKGENFNLFLTLSHLAIQFYSWECKLAKKIPTANWVLGETIYMLNIAFQNNRNIRDSLTNSDSNLSRLWDRLVLRQHHERAAVPGGGAAEVGGGAGPRRG